MSEPAAFLITWACYGTWLHGDPRGSVDLGHNTPGTPFIGPDGRRRRVESRMKGPSVRLTGRARRIVQTTIAEHCARRGWNLLASNVRTNHVHVVVAYAGVRPEKIMGEFKAWASRRLRDAGLLGQMQPVWTRGGSTRYIWKESSIPAAVEYVLEGQDVRR